MSAGPDIYRIPQVDHIEEEETLSIFASQTDKFCVIYTCMQIMLCWESQGPRSQLLFKLSCLVIFVCLKKSLIITQAIQFADYESLQSFY